ncbi:MAG: pirin family protein [Hyphomicrobiales bacterium]|nr:pirin family protein [Rickettsiales bacterium]MCP5361971.1 pirin family protein [Hyphomicrobiales bacterium]
MTLRFRPANTRGKTQLDWLTSYHTFSFADYQDSSWVRFHTLRVINDDIVAPSGGFATHGHQDMEILTYVLSGALEHKDSLGNGSVIRPGEIQHMSAGSGIRHSEFNPSNKDPVHLLQIWVFPSKKNLTPRYQQVTIPIDGMQNQWQCIAAPETGEHHIQIHQDAYIYVTKLQAGSTLNFEVTPGRGQWLHVAKGRCSLLASETMALQAGDGLGIENESRFSVQTSENTEILLFDLA